MLTLLRLGKVVKLTPTPYCIDITPESIDPEQFKFCDFSRLYCRHFSIRSTTGVLNRLPESRGHCLNYACLTIYTILDIFGSCSI